MRRHTSQRHARHAEYGPSFLLLLLVLGAYVAVLTGVFVLLQSTVATLLHFAGLFAFMADG